MSWVAVSTEFLTLSRAAIYTIISREMSQTVRIGWKHILSQVRISVRSSNFFIREKHPKYRGNRVASACGYLNIQRSALSQAERTVTVGRNRISIACAAYGDGGDGCVFARMRMRACARGAHMHECVHAHACMYARVRVCMRDVFAIYDKIFDPGW